MNKPVSLEIAKLLKEKGINIQSNQQYKEEDGCKTILIPLNMMACGGFFKMYNAPIIIDVVMFIYKQYDIWINIEPFDDSEAGQILWSNEIIELQKEFNDASDYTYYHEPKEAYEAAIECTLHNLI